MSPPSINERARERERERSAFIVSEEYFGGPRVSAETYHVFEAKDAEQVLDHVKVGDQQRRNRDQERVLLRVVEHEDATDDEQDAVHEGEESSKLADAVLGSLVVAPQLLDGKE